MEADPEAETIMRSALRLAARGLGRVWPNPAVGAILIKDGRVVGRGWTQPGGRPHAEAMALAQAGEAARDATLYVTLEPCAHKGKAPPCTEAILNAGVSRVVAAMIDPFPEVNGKGFARLREQGVEVIAGICEDEARVLNAGFFSVLARKRPWITLKIASTQDDHITLQGRQHARITGDQAQAYVHRMRREHDAILTGSGTALADDPLLTCRLPGCEQDSPQRVLLDRQLRVPASARLWPAWVFASEAVCAQQEEKCRILEAQGARIFRMEDQDGTLSLPSVLAVLAEQGITRLMVEAGAGLNTAFLQAGLADAIFWFHSPQVAGAGGLKAFAGSLPSFYHPRECVQVGEDSLTRYVKQE